MKVTIEVDASSGADAARVLRSVADALAHDSYTSGLHEMPGASATYRVERENYPAPLARDAESCNGSDHQ